MYNKKYLYYIGNCTCFNKELLNNITMNDKTLKGKDKLYYAKLIEEESNFSLDYILENYIGIYKNYLIFSESGIEYIYEIE